MVAEEKELETVCHQLAERVAPLHRLLSPDSFNNMCLFEEAASDCRLGRQPGGRPYSGITTVVDFCAHSHRDTTNMVGGCTAIVTLTKPEIRGSGVPDEEQFHTLPMYVPDLGQAELAEAEASGGLSVLDRFKKKVVLGQKGPSISKRRTPKRKAGPPTPTNMRPSPRKKIAFNDYPFAALLQETQYESQQQFAFSHPEGLGTLGYPSNAPAWFPPPLGCVEIGAAEGDLNGREDEDAGSQETTESCLANIQIYESDCEEAFRYVGVRRKI